jgi:hypothetical protein
MVAKSVSHSSAKVESSQDVHKWLVVARFHRLF